MSEKTGKILSSPMKDQDLVTTFTAARLFFPDDKISTKHIRWIQRLCQSNELESYKFGRRYHIVRQSIFDYIEKSHYRTKKFSF